MNHRRTMSTSSLIGDRVYNPAGEELGRIEDLMLDIETGRVAYAVLHFGGYTGLGNRLFAVPWSALQLDDKRRAFVLEVDKNTLKSAPGFDQDDWPDLSNVDYARSVYSHYGAKYWG